MTNSNIIILGIDIQDKLVKMIENSAMGKFDVKNNAIKLLKAAKILDIKTILTQQYPKGLGDTIEEIKNIKDFKTFDKNSFSALDENEIREYFPQNYDKKTKVIVFGIETHICVYQTVLDLIKTGFMVDVVCDCCASRDEFNHKTALELMKQKGAEVKTLEILLFEFLKSSKHPNFKEIQGLIK